MRILKIKLIVAMRGRGGENIQTLEPNQAGISNTITTVTKDNLVLEIWKVTDDSTRVTSN